MNRLFISVKEFALKIGVSDKTVYRMLNDNQIPFAVKIGGQWRFRADNVEKWTSPRSVDGGTIDSIDYTITIAKALQNGSVMYRIQGCNRDEALDELLLTIPRTGEFNPKNFKYSILAREALAPSSLAGIACMAPSSDHPVFLDRSLIIFGFLEDPTDFKALDGLPAEVIILVLAANASEQAILETRLRRLLLEPAVSVEIRKQLPRKELLQYLQEREETLLPPGKLKAELRETSLPFDHDEVALK
ncbi:MAG: helix-turn-helix domain-containing protein [Proteobacteria bacterium]|nr:helix-turn-helix domain-containing protein [Pseudomonadota bacterium]MBU1710912.1 helix-turn-helix domain-containing protein [Pseudomonadota bacterium]